MSKDDEYVLSGHLGRKKGDVHFDNEDLDGTMIRFYHIEGDNFGIEVILPTGVKSRIDFDKMKSGEHPKGYYTMGRIMEVAMVLTKQAAMHPECVEATNFDGSKSDIADLGVDKMIMGMLEEVAKEQYERECAEGIVPEGMSFEEWIEVAQPDTKSKKTIH